MEDCHHNSRYLYTPRQQHVVVGQEFGSPSDAGSPSAESVVQQHVHSRSEEISPTLSPSLPSPEASMLSINLPPSAQRALIDAVNEMQGGMNSGGRRTEELPHDSNNTFNNEHQHQQCHHHAHQQHFEEDHHGPSFHRDNHQVRAPPSSSYVCPKHNSSLTASRMDSHFQSFQSVESQLSPLQTHVNQTQQLQPVSNRSPKKRNFSVTQLKPSASLPKLPTRPTSKVEPTRAVTPADVHSQARHTELAIHHIFGTSDLHKTQLPTPTPSPPPSYAPTKPLNETRFRETSPPVFQGPMLLADIRRFENSEPDSHTTQRTPPGAPHTPQTNNEGGPGAPPDLHHPPATATTAGEEGIAKPTDGERRNPSHTLPVQRGGNVIPSGKEATTQEETTTISVDESHDQHLHPHSHPNPVRVKSSIASGGGPTGRDRSRGAVRASRPAPFSSLTSLPIPAQTRFALHQNNPEKFQMPERVNTSKPRRRAKSVMIAQSLTFPPEDPKISSSSHSFENLQKHRDPPTHTQSLSHLAPQSSVCTLTGGPLVASTTLDKSQPSLLGAPGLSMSLSGGLSLSSGGLSSKTRDLERKLKDLLGRNETLQGEIHRGQRRLKEVAEQNAQLKRKTQQAESDRNTARAQQLLRERQMMAVKAEMESLERDLQRHKQKTAQAEEEREGMRGEAENASKKAAEDLEESKKETARTAAREETAWKRVKELESRLQERDTQLEEIRKTSEEKQKTTRRELQLVTLEREKLNEIQQSLSQQVRQLSKCVEDEGKRAERLTEEKEGEARRVEAQKEETERFRMHAEAEAVSAFARLSALQERAVEAEVQLRQAKARAETAEAAAEETKRAAEQKEKERSVEFEVERNLLERQSEGLRQTVQKKDLSATKYRELATAAGAFWGKVRSDLEESFSTLEKLVTCARCSTRDSERMTLTLAPCGHSVCGECFSISQKEVRQALEGAILEGERAGLGRDRRTTLETISRIRKATDGRLLCPLCWTQNHQQQHQQQHGSAQEGEEGSKDGSRRLETVETADTSVDTHPSPVERSTSVSLAELEKRAAATVAAHAFQNAPVDELAGALGSLRSLLGRISEGARALEGLEDAPLED
uniref:RING-type domain-containing protein n=1 Tax=Chromera velia CCMP2878 TaxID=1169474 RepID=A0A0G4HHW2_9ALVE|eukprot:Cvel_6864.t1-p1 / transcript=Cvel_6864.t1 / gene=Cvel_6864 / organism=Chromera_velia_CCMP2878 / gene_product=hypothetical protein / transcript_product=hypothetical protein / location=Cvel_scaffold347:5427-9778(-) / protein_length=1105 / sequence_SO=supercontig / SO=protein_coding / is_pseudo=false